MQLHEQMDVVVHSAGLDQNPFFIPDNSSNVWKDEISQLPREDRTPLLGAEYDVEIEGSKCAGH